MEGRRGDNSELSHRQSPLSIRSGSVLSLVLRISVEGVWRFSLRPYEVPKIHHRFSPRYVLF